jgi:hypothetical protein
VFETRGRAKGMEGEDGEEEEAEEEGEEEEKIVQNRKEPIMVTVVLLLKKRCIYSFRRNHKGTNIYVFMQNLQLVVVF